MRTMTKHGVGGIFDRSSSVGTPVQGAARYSADQRPQLLAGFGDWTPGQPTPDTTALVAHGYYRGADPAAAMFCSPDKWAPEWDCNDPNLKLVSLFAQAKDGTGQMVTSNGVASQLIDGIRRGRLSLPPGFPPLNFLPGVAPPSALGPTVAGPMTLSSGSNWGLYLGLGAAVLALGGAVLVKKKRAKAS